MSDTTAHYYSPEKLSLWDRIFNRYKTFPIEQGTENWTKNLYDIPKLTYQRDYVVYHKVDRLTGGYEVIKKYLN